MDATRSAPPPVILALMGTAVLVAVLDVMDSIQNLLGGTAGAVLGTLVRDVLLVVAAVFTLRRAWWARWALLVLFAFGLVRALAADEVLEWVGAASAAVGFVLTLLPASRAWFKPREVPAQSTDPPPLP